MGIMEGCFFSTLSKVTKMMVGDFIISFNNYSTTLQPFFAKNV